MKICVRLHDFGKSDAVSLAKKAKNMGFEGVQFVLNKAISEETGLAGSLSKEKANYYRDIFMQNNLEIAMLGAYFNPVHSNKELVKNNILKFKEHLKFSNEFGSSLVGTETGSFNDDKWTYNPLNRTQDAFNTVKDIFSDLADCALKNNTNLAIEGAYGHCMYNPQALKKLFLAIDNNHVKIIVDIFNYLDISNFDEQVNIFNECLSLFDDKIVLFHLKDFIIDNDKLVQVGLGQGLMRWDLYLPIIKEKYPNSFLVFEGVKPDDMESSLKFINKYL